MRVLLTGGGTGGHVIPNLAVIAELKRVKDLEILYVGSRGGMEKDLIEKTGVNYRAIVCGKMRRYFSWENFLDFFKFWIGIIQAFFILRKFRPAVVFSKGGYVSLPVMIAAWLLKIPTVLHESDATPGLANKIGMIFASKICLSFPETKNLLSTAKLKKTVVTGNPIRKFLFRGTKKAGYEMTGFSADKAVILVMGGSLGAEQINKLVRSSLNELLENFQIVHITGRGNMDKTIRRKYYAQYEYLDEEMKDIYAMADLIISRAGANSLAEMAGLKKRAIIIPLSTAASRGDQIENAKIYVRKLGWSMMYGDISKKEFLGAVNLAALNAINKSEEVENGVDKIVEIILRMGK